MAKSQSVIAPFYSEEPEIGQVVTAAVGAQFPAAIINLAPEASSAEGEACVGHIVGDMSPSMIEVMQAFVDGFALLRKSLSKCTERRKMHIGVTLFDENVTHWEPHGHEHPYMSVIEDHPQCLPELTTDVYNPRSGNATAMYSADLQGLARLDAFSKALADEDVGQDLLVRNFFMHIGDGLDNRSKQGDRQKLERMMSVRTNAEFWTTLYFGLIDPLYADVIGRHMGINVGVMQEDEYLEFYRRIFTCIACGGDEEMEKTLKDTDVAWELRISGDIGGMGFDPSGVLVFPRDPDEIRDLIGVKLSTTLVNVSAGKITTKNAGSQIGGPSGSVIPTSTTPTNANGDDEDGNDDEDGSTFV